MNEVRLMRFFVLVCIVLLSVGCAIPGDKQGSQQQYWGHWRGPTGNGVALQGNPPVEWSETKNVKWKVEIPGRGSASPVVWGDQIFVSTALAGEKAEGQKLAPQKSVLLCLDRATGDVRWQQTANELVPHENHHGDHGFASASPCTDGERVYAHFGSRGLFCYDMSGKFLWKKTDFLQLDIMNDFGEGSSPTLYRDVLIVPADHDGKSLLYALDTKTGVERWKVERDEVTNWVTPIVVEHDGKVQIITVGEKFARGHDFETGKELWRCSGANRRPVASPVAGHGLVFLANGHRGFWMVGARLGGSGDITGTEHVVWKLDDNAPDIGSPVLSGRRLFFSKKKTGMMSCFDAVTGKPHYELQRTGIKKVYASLVGANGKIYLTGRDGTTVVLEDSDEFKVVATNRMDEGIDASPAIVDNEIFLRGAKHLYCVSEVGK
jgi:outer membrane protein assembly factor BamB